MQQDLNMNTYTLVYDIYARAHTHTQHTQQGYDILQIH